MVGVEGMLLVLLMESSMGEGVTDVIELENDVTELSHEVQILPDYSGLREEKIPRVGLQFDSLQLALEFYATYAKKVSFVSKIKTTIFNSITKEFKKPINQSIHCNREGFCESCVKAATRKNTIAAMGYRARIYAKFDREKEDQVLLKVELGHSHPCCPKMAVHYHEYRELIMHAKCVIEDNDEIGIRPNKTYLPLANEVGELSNLGYSEKDVRNYITTKLRSTDINADVKEILNYFM
ncbi:protein FAR1-RELATED SEQUENCE 5-like [Arachis ipaensis]|uniref:protein FAR1-RELATED SEQUENCE 5-like n=1 Tax=Arachis ipaensis TaxID=130454 RepID=UPI0007AF3AFF|nr:protein FAR1-RELATED SEQUENCE 5-like [Arachis ipaensis]